MRTNAVAHPWRTSPAWSAVFRAVGLSILGFIGWPWFVSADDSAWKADSLVAAVAARRGRRRHVVPASRPRREAVAGCAGSVRRARTSEGDSVTEGLSCSSSAGGSRLPTPGNGQIRCGLTTELLLMSDNHPTTCEQDARRESSAAEPTSAAHPLVPRRGPRGSWTRAVLKMASPRMARRTMDLAVLLVVGLAASEARAQPPFGGPPPMGGPPMGGPPWRLSIA